MRLWPWAVLAAGLSIAACDGSAPGGNDGGGGGGGGSVNPTSAVLDWTAPTTNADNTPLTDLGGYRIYYGTSPGSSAQTIDVGNVLTYTINNLSSGTYYFRVTAYDTAGNESAPSNEASKTIP
jgi:hypothetical protein